MRTWALDAVLLSSAVAWVPPWTPPEEDFKQCDTDIFLDGAQYMNMKGLVMDDITFRYCASRVPTTWPNVKRANVGTLRLFRSWSPGWPSERRELMWDQLVSFIKEGNVKVLMGTPVTCNAEADAQDWEWTKALMSRFGPEHVMGFAVGNELELLFQHKSVSQECVDELWGRGRLWRVFQERIREIDEMGFSHVSVTSVFTSGIVYSGDKSLPFRNVPHEALTNDFLRNATSKYYSRFVFAVNIYPYFDPTLKVKPPHYTCESAIDIATCFDKPRCLTNKALSEVKRKITQLTQQDGYRVWIGEIGWSSPQADALSTHMAKCPTFSSAATLQKFYENFLKWDLSITARGRPEADHAFYFTMRDALNFGNQEYFGLMKSCNNMECKLHSKDYVPPNLLRRYSWLNISFAVSGSAVISMALFGALCATVAERRREIKAARLASSSEDSEDSSSEDS